MIALLYRNLDDSAVQHFGPDYMARISGDGSFNFHNLPAGTFRLYALQDADGGRTYNSKKETFAFFDSVIIIQYLTLLMALTGPSSGPSTVLFLLQVWAMSRITKNVLKKIAT